ncbi:YaiO family outer membrane protein [Luteimonas cucumeris]|uniref:YaiO family outer membrane protein n=1 Tax=Luteimonas cucumeris TaxID=985012 RepID=A0A562LAT3_9GAMM|nr:YaiO family outer membrane beta-barrel protein [Luteimonas cucumeris]TWI04574.1 YaiO family outer membrane protein [Luteimonas cucumeris]
MILRGLAAALLAIGVAPCAAFAQTLQQQAQALLDQRQYAAAAELLEHRLEASPGDTDARFMLARTHAWSGEPARALPLYEKLLVDEPDNTDYLFGYGQALLWSGQPDRAVEVLERAQRLAPDYAELAQLLAQARDAAPSAQPSDATAEASTPEQAVAAPLPQQRYRSIAFSARRDWLDGTYDDWANLRFDVADTQAGRVGAYGALVGDRRFGMNDQGIEAGLIVPLTATWTLQPEIGLVSDADFLPRYYADLRVQRVFANGWIGAASLRTSDYPDGRVDRLALGAERYWGVWRAAYTFNLTRLHGSDSPGHDLRLARAYGDRNETGLQIAFGREAALAGTGVVVSDVRALILFGRHVLAGNWSLLWNMGIVDQGDLYTRRSLGLGLERRF